MTITNQELILNLNPPTPEEQLSRACELAELIEGGWVDVVSDRDRFLTIKRVGPTLPMLTCTVS